jgi:ribosomal protein S18 acetylase RimI-like enzyme
LVKRKIHIRRANLDDAELISELSAVTFFDTFKGTCTDEDMQEFIDKCFKLEQVSKELSDGDDFYFIAFLNHEAAGYIRLKEDISHVEKIDSHKGIELKRIYVLKEYHSQKIGADLMNFALDFAAKNNYELIWLGVWEHNERAKSFYKKFGFNDTGVMHDFPIGRTPQTDHWFFKLIESA